MKEEAKSQVVSVRLNTEQLEFLSAIKTELETDLEAEVSMATVIRRLISRVMSKHQHRRGGGEDRMARFIALEERVKALESRIASLEQ